MKPRQFSLPSRDRRLTGIAATVLVHAMLIVAWRASRQVPLHDDGEPPSFLLLQLPLRVPDVRVGEKPAGRASRSLARRRMAVQTRPEQLARALGNVDSTAAVVPSLPAPNGIDARPPAAAPAVSAPSDSVRRIVARARREAGAVDRALRKENNPYIVAPLDSPQIRMRRKIDEAAALAPNRLWEAPRIEELVNDTGDGARRTRVITAAGIYCVTERSPASSIDTIEKDGKRRITNCGHEHEQPATTQKWRTARD